jgi:hypothetical protein
MLIINKLNLKDDMDNEETTLEDSVSPSLLEKERGGEFIKSIVRPKTQPPSINDPSRERPSRVHKNS